MCNSIWEEMVIPTKFYDRFIEDNVDNGYEIILPLKNSTPLFRQNLISWYREIPISRILVGDAGPDDDSLEVLGSFPRVEFFDHKKYKTSGYSIKRLIDEVRTDWLIYLHCDVF